jgi:hypothetical protein
VDWFDPPWRRRSRVKITAMGVAATIAEGIVAGTNVLLARLAEQGFAWTHPARISADECLLECVLFEWFLRELAISYASGSETKAIRAALAGRVLVDLQRSGLSAGSLGDFDRRHRERFAEYTFSAGLGASLQPLGALAWQRISGNDQPSERMTMLLAIRASAELARLRGFTESYRIVAHAQSPPPPAGQP